MPLGTLLIVLGLNTTFSIPAAILEIGMTAMVSLRMLLAASAVEVCMWIQMRPPAHRLQTHSDVGADRVLMKFGTRELEPLPLLVGIESHS